MKSITNELVYKNKKQPTKTKILLKKFYRKTSVNKILLTSFKNKYEKKR
jgi:hypothetical protein